MGFGREGESYGLVLDGFVLSETPQLAISSGRASRVPLLIGVNDDESTSLLAPSLVPQTVAAYEAQVRMQFPLIANQVLARYPASAYSSPGKAIRTCSMNWRLSAPTGVRQPTMPASAHRSITTR